MVIGNHTWSHPLLSRLTIDEQENEIGKNHEWLNSMINRSVKSISIPYGKLDSFNEDTISVLSKLSYESSYVTERGINVGRRNPYYIFRIDTNELRMQST